MKAASTEFFSVSEKEYQDYILRQRKKLSPADRQRVHQRIGSLDLFLSNQKEIDDSGLRTTNLAQIIQNAGNLFTQNTLPDFVSGVIVTVEGQHYVINDKHKPPQRLVDIEMIRAYDLLLKQLVGEAKMNITPNSILTHDKDYARKWWGVWEMMKANISQDPSLMPTVFTGKNG